MENGQQTLGLCSSANRLFYALADPDIPGSINNVGSIDFSFSVSSVLENEADPNFEGLRDAITQVIREQKVKLARIVTIPAKECWSMLPKSVYDESEEREAYLQVLMFGNSRKELQPYWYDLTNQDYKLLAIRRNQTMRGYSRLTEFCSSAEFCSDFEIGDIWSSHSGSASSFLTVSCYDGLLSISSFLLGKLRATTYFEFEDISDLPYLWLHCGEIQPWINGMHDEILFYGHQAPEVAEILKPYLKEGEVRVMNSLSSMQLLHAEDQQFSFELAEAFPAIMLAVK